LDLADNSLRVAPVKQTNTLSILDTQGTGILFIHYDKNFRKKLHGPAMACCPRLAMDVHFMSNDSKWKFLIPFSQDIAGRICGRKIGQGTGKEFTG